MNKTVLSLLVSFFALLVAFSSLAQAETRYLVSLPDIPLMPQMVELKDKDVVFDKAEGRIIEETVQAPHLTREQVLKFYDDTLPALGWIKLTPKNSLVRFSRNGEQLIVNLEKLGSEGLISFAVSPNQP